MKKEIKEIIKINVNYISNKDGISYEDSQHLPEALTCQLLPLIKSLMDEEELVEILSDIEHERWNGWQEYLHSKCNKNPDGSLTIPSGYVKNLERLINTPYSDLIEKEKESDREEARKNIKAIKQWWKEN